MNVSGFSVVFFLIGCILLCGCVQVTINPPQVPGTSATMATPTPGGTVVTGTSDKAAIDTSPQAGYAQSVTNTPQFIVPVGDLSRIGHRSFTFHYAPYSGPKEYTIRVPVNMSVYYGARQMKISLPANSDNPEEIKAYINSFESDPAMEELYNSVLSELRTARYQNGGNLSDDEYLELIVAFVQQIPYVENPSPIRKYPVEVIYDKAGDSDEKSLLLAQLLAREGYDVSLMVYEDLGYETTGIRIQAEMPDSSLRVFTDGKKDYVFIDAGIPRFIGSVPSAFQNAEDPAIYPVGNGTKSYGPINYVWKIVADLKHMAELKKINSNTVINTWDKHGTCSWIKNSKLLQGTTCYCCDI
jgi:hypothetical protein